MVTRSQQLKNLQERRINAIKAREKERQRNDDRIKKGLSRDAGITLAQNLQNRRLLAINQLIAEVKKGVLLKSGRIQPFINAAMSRFETQSSIERLRGKKITKLASAEGISRQEAAKSIRLARSRLRGVLGGKSITQLTISDAMKLSPRERKILGIKISPRKIDPTIIPRKKKPFEKPPGIVSAVKKPKGIGLGRTVAEIRQEVQTLNTKRVRGKLTKKESLQLAGSSISLVTAATGLSVEKVLRNPKILTELPLKLPSLVRSLPSIISKEGETFGIVARDSPERATGIIAGNIVTFIGASKAISALERGGTKVLGKVIAKDIQKTGIGVKTIKNVKGVGDIEIIPRGTFPKLEVDPIKAVREAKLLKQLRTTPKIPKLSNLQKGVIDVVKKRGDAVTGSFAQQTLLKKPFARKFKDIDIVTKNQEALKKAIKKKLKGRVRFTTLHIKDKKTGKRIKVIRVIDARTNKLIADLDPLNVAEQGFIKKFGITKHKGLRIVRQEARLAAKVRQLGDITRRTPRRKVRKVKKDIELLFGKKVKLDVPAVKGGFGFSKKELEKLVGKVGPITTAQINLLGRGILKPSQLKLKRWLFASPFNPKTGKAQFRVSRLGISKDNEARLLDILGLGDEVSFRKSKPQIFVFPKEKIFPPGKKLRKDVASRTSKGFIIPKFSSELEVVLGKGFIIKRGKTLSRVNIDGRIVPIIELKKVKLSGSSKRLISQRSKTIGRLRKGKLSRNQKRSLTNRLRREDTKLNRQLKRETGLDYNLGISKRPKRARFVDIKSKGLSALPKRISKISPGISPKRRPAKTPPKSPLRRPGKITPPISPKPSPPKSRPPSPPKSPPKIPPRVPPKGVVRPPIALRRKKRKLKIKRKGQPGFNVEGKSKGKWIRLNRKPLRKIDAHSRGAWAIDHSTARTYRINPAGKPKSFGNIKKKEQGYFNRKKRKFRDFRIVKGKKKKLINKRIEKTRHAIDTRREKKQLSLARLIKQERFTKRPTRKTKPLKRTPTRRRRVDRGIFG